VSIGFMRILMLVPDAQMIDRRVLQQAQTLSEAGNEVNLIAGFECAAEAHYRWHGVDIHRFTYDWDDERLKRIRRALPNNDRVHLLVNQLFMKIIRKALPLSSFDLFMLTKCREFVSDVIHVHDLPLLHHAASLAHEWKVPLVFDAHEIYYEQSVLSPRQRARLKREERRSLPTVTLFSTVNEGIADFYEKRYGRKPLVLLNATTPPAEGFDTNSRQKLHSAAGIPDSAKVVLYQGWISSERNLMTLVHSAEFFSDNVYLILIGYGSYEAELKAALENKPWAERVRFLGRVDPDQILSFTAGADVGIIPYQPIDLNHTLCSPNKFFEFVQSGVPVIAHDLYFFREMAKQYRVVAVGDLSNPHAMAETILQIVCQEDRLEEMRLACKRTAQELNWDVEGQKLLDAYQKYVTPVLTERSRN